MNNSQIVIALLDLMSDLRDVIDENRQEEAEKLFKIAYELIYSPLINYDYYNSEILGRTLP